MNNDFIAHNSFYHLQKDPDDTNIQRVPLKRTNGGLRCKGRGYKRKGTSQKEGINNFQEKGSSVKTKEVPIKEMSSLSINKKPILEPT